MTQNKFLLGPGYDYDRRTPRFIKEGIEAIEQRINNGKNTIMRTYYKQFVKNWKINYEFVYKAYFMKIASMLKLATER